MTDKQLSNPEINLDKTFYILRSWGAPRKPAIFIIFVKIYIIYSMLLLVTNFLNSPHFSLFPLKIDMEYLSNCVLFADFIIFSLF